MTNETPEHDPDSIEGPGYGSAGDEEKESISRRPSEARIRAALSRAGVVAVRVIGPPGSGKTELIEATLRHLPGRRRVAVIAVDPAATREADRLRNLCGFVAHLESVVPDPAQIWQIISKLHLADFDFILIEGCGGMAPLKDIGQDATAAVLAISGGDDKALEYRALLKGASVILLTKIDLRKHVKFDERVFHDDARVLVPKADIIELSAVTGSGIYHWLEWLDKTCTAKKRRNLPNDLGLSASNTYFG
jgi:hydrogenase nickel incorporation protein HypB